jgi:hypothetical protein
MDNPSQTQIQRDDILAKLSAISTMDRGTLAEEYREAPNPNGHGTIKHGPYFKHQCWEDKKNRSKRVNPNEASLLREDLENGQLFNRLIEQLAELNIANARERRKRLNDDGTKEVSDAKKNSSAKSSKKDTRKPKPSSTGSPHASATKGSKT